MRSTRNDGITHANRIQPEFFNGILEICTAGEYPCAGSLGFFDLACDPFDQGAMDGLRLFEC